VRPLSLVDANAPVGPTVGERDPVTRETYLDQGLTPGAGFGHIVPQASFRPHPALPAIGHLDYLNKAATSVLIVVAVVLLVRRGLANPARAVRMLARGAEHHTGVK
jgi:hypothetical protein